MHDAPALACPELACFGPLAALCGCLPWRIIKSIMMIEHVPQTARFFTWLYVTAAQPVQVPLAH